MSFEGKKEADFYVYCDKIISFLNKQFVDIFGKTKSLLSIEEVNIIEFSYQMYSKLDNITKKAFLKLANKVYKKHGGKEELDLIWLLGFLTDYDEVTKYVYTNEVDRKRSRLAEALIVGDTNGKETKRALNLWSAMVQQYAITVTDKAVLEAYRENGVTKVVWYTADDDRVCDICASRHGQVYGIDKIPAKPHIGCRCYMIPYKAGVTV